jgi:hypothetical protein
MSNRRMPSMEGRPMSRQRKHDANNNLEAWTKKQHNIPGTLQVGYREHKEQPFSEMSHTHSDFFGFVPPPSYERTQASTGKKCYNYVVTAPVNAH